MLCLIAKILSYSISVPSFLCLQSADLTCAPQVNPHLCKLEVSLGKLYEDGTVGRKWAFQLLTWSLSNPEDAAASAGRQLSFRLQGKSV